MHAHKIIVADVSVTCPMAAAYNSIASEVPLAAAATRARRKVAKYREAVEDHHCHTFLPFVLESFGAFDHSAIQFIQKMTNAVELPLRKAFHAELATIVAVQLQEGNFDIVESAIRQSRADLDAIPLNGSAP